MLSWFDAIPTISLATADRFYAWGWRFSLIGAAVTAAAVMCLYWGTYVRDRNAAAQLGALNAEAASSRERAGKLEVEAQRLDRENIKLREALAWRRLSQTQFDQLTESLRQLRPQLEGKLGTWVYNEAEASNLATQISAAIRKAGFQSVPGNGVTGGSVPFYGVRVDDRQFPAEAHLLRDALVRAGVKTDAGPVDVMMVSNPGIILAVSLRPPPK